VRWKDVLLLGLVTGCGFLVLCKAEECDWDAGRSGGYASGGHSSARRQLTDPANARVLGTVTHDGRTVAGARIEAIVYPPLSYVVTIDHALSKLDGTFSVPITAENLVTEQRVELTASLPGFYGRTHVMVAPGEPVTNVALEVGSGVTIRGRVTGANGVPAGRYDGRGVAVCLGADCEAANEDGSFELTSFELGSKRFEVAAGGTRRAVRELPMRRVSPRIDTQRLNGVIQDVALEVDVAASERLFARGSYHCANAGGAHVRVVAVRGVALPRDLQCDTRNGRRRYPIGDGRGPLVLPIVHCGETKMIDCEAGGFEHVWIYEPAPGGVIDVPLVRARTDDIDLGVVLRSEPTGARVVDVADEAEAAGLRPGDVVTAIEGISVANVDVRIVRALGFRLPPGQSVELAVTRGDQEVAFTVRSPAAR
jgi:hypothetical protein